MESTETISTSPRILAASKARLDLPDAVGQTRARCLLI